MTDGILGRLALVDTADYPGTIIAGDPPGPLFAHGGIAYQFLPRTVLRASYGINWLTTTGNQLLDSADRNVGFGSMSRIFQRHRQQWPDLYFYIQQSHAERLRLRSPTNNITALNYAIEGQWLDAPAYKMKPGYEHTVSLGIQREIGSGRKLLGGRSELQR